MDTKYILIAVQPSPTIQLQNCFHLTIQKLCIWSIITPPSPLIPAPGNPHSIFCVYDFTALSTSYKWNHPIFICFVTGLFHLAQYPQGSSMSLHIVEYLSFSRLNDTPLYVCMTFCLSIHLSMDIQVAPHLAYREQCYKEHGSANPSSRSCF